MFNYFPPTDTHGDGRPRGFAHVEYNTKEQAISCHTSALEEPLYFAGRDLVIDYAKDLTQNQEPNSKLYFLGCAEGESALKEIFSGHTDNIVSIYYCEDTFSSSFVNANYYFFFHLVRDGNTGEQLARGFIEFKSVGAATEALNELNNAQTPSGESLALSYARPPRMRDERPRNPRMGNPRREKYTARSWTQ